MEQIYLKTAPKLQDSYTFVTRSQVVEGSDPEDQMLLTKDSHKLVAQSLNVPELGAEVERAIHQVEQTLEGAKILKEEKQELERYQKEQEKEQERQQEQKRKT